MDKVMQISNERLDGYRAATKETEKFPVFNGQLGTVRSEWPPALKQFRNQRGPVKFIRVESTVRRGCDSRTASPAGPVWIGFLSCLTRSLCTRVKGASSGTCSWCCRAWLETSWAGNSSTQG